MSLPGSPLSPSQISQIPSPKASFRTSYRHNSSDISPVLPVGARSWARSASGAQLRRFLSNSSGFLQTTEPESDWNPFLGFIGSRRTAKYPAETSYKRMDQFLSSEDRLKGQCFKIDKFSEQQNSVQRALLYLKLRQDGCSKAKSIVFTKKRRCMFDTTQKHDGPSCHRTLIIGDNRASGPNWKGWQLHAPKVEVGRRFQPVESDIDRQEYEAIARGFERMVEKQERRRKGEDFYEGDENRKKYFEELRREWRKRQGNKRPKDSPKAEKQESEVKEGINVGEIVEERKEVEELKEEEGKKHRSRTLPFSLPFFPTISPPTSLPASPKPAPSPKSYYIPISKVHRTNSCSLVIRNIHPNPPDTPKFIRNAERQKTHEEKKRERVDLGGVDGEKRRKTVISYTDLLAKIKGRSSLEALKTRAEHMTGPELAKEQLIVGIARLYFSSLSPPQVNPHSPVLRRTI